MQKSAKTGFSATLLRWNSAKNDRKMPWKGEKDPYKIWLSEIILQQTRVEQGLGYYERMVKAFPTIKKLAKANDNQVFKLWEGLGYYSRCRNLLATARSITNERKGIFPSTYDEILALKGVGTYTAAAISSFAFNLPYAVVDGNVFRVLARVFGIDLPIDTTEGKKKFTALAQSLLDLKRPGLYNQAIMDFGAVVCKPVSPQCGACPFSKTCVALAQKKVAQWPVKSKTLALKQRWFYFLLLQYRGRVAVRVRDQKDIWQGLYEFPLLETASAATWPALSRQAEKKGWLVSNAYRTEQVSVLYRQTLSHQLIAGQFIHVSLKKKPVLGNQWQWVEYDTLDQLAFPQFINQHLKADSRQSSLF
ncbi:MAG: A/G-specific adenine glycosylase [Sphingomonadales bacterium]|nr:A/G-specific adenine glycosylase [Sphingomonadales bacterium]